MKPKPYRKSTGFSRFVLAGFLIAAAHSAHAQTTYFWDADGDATEDTGGSGIWNSSSLLWRIDSDIGTLSEWPNAEPDADYARLEGTPGTVTLNSDSEDIIVNRIIFGTSGYEIEGPASGSATLKLSGSGPQVNTGTGVSAEISASISGSIGFTKTGAGTLALSGSNSYTGVTSVASTSTNGGIVNVSGDQSAADGGWNIHGLTTVNFLSDSIIALGGGKNITLANSASAGIHTLNVEGTVTSAGALVVRGRSTLNLESGSDWTQSGNLTIQPQNTAFNAVMNVRSGSSFTINGTANITLARSATGNSGSANLNISGGTFTTSRAFSNINAGTGSGHSRLVFSNGGTLKISEDIPSLIIEGSSTFGVLTNNAAGGVIDTNGFSTAINVPVSGAGSLTKAGEGTLTLSAANTYQGNTTVSGGTLVLEEENPNNDSSTVTISGSGVMQLDYAGTDIVDKLFIGTTQQAAGEYGKVGSASPVIGIPEITGDGTLTVVSSPVGTPFDLFMAGYPDLTGDDALSGADPDGDGLSNLAEFIMGGTAPDSGSAANRPVEAVIDGHLTISILVPSGATFAGIPSPSANVQGVDVAVGGSIDLATFARPVEETVINPDLPTAPTGYQWHTFRLGEPISSRPSGFLRASFSIP